MCHYSDTNDPEPDVYFYHSDHLGSAAYLTNDDGKVTQTLNYLPYGEDWVDVRYDLDPSLGQYRFNGKEKDHESGFHYYGARYYWSELLTGWLSVDPLMDKYPNISPYNYCEWNPVIFVDPNGKEKVISLTNSTRDNKIACAADNFEDDENVIHLWAHGNPNMVQTVNPDCTKNDITTSEGMNIFLCEESSLYQNRTADETLILVMHSRSTGKGEDNIAKKNSSGLGLLVIAPTLNIQVETHNEGTPSQVSYDMGAPVLSNGKTIGLGSWNVYYKGVLVDTLNQNLAPKINNPQEIIEKYEIIYQQKIQGE